jgi:hypothetical protein
MGSLPALIIVEMLAPKLHHAEDICATFVKVTHLTNIKVGLCRVANNSFRILARQIDPPGTAYL